MAQRCEHGFISGLCVIATCTHWDHGRVPRIEQTGVTVATRSPRHHPTAQQHISNERVVEALKGASTQRIAARRLGCAQSLFHYRAQHSAAVRAALEERHGSRGRRPA